MSRFRNALPGVLLALALGAVPAVAQRPAPQAVALDTLTWAEAEAVMTPEAVVVLPLGAATKEHGLHLPLNTDLLQALYFARRIAEAATAPTVIAPPLAYGHYPAFLEYHGSTTLRAETQRDVIVDLVRGWAGQGPKRFYVVNIGISTIRPVTEAAHLLALDGILLRAASYPDLIASLPSGLLEQAGGSHADEVETSLMLYIAPEEVHMERAEEDFRPRRPPALTRNPDGPGTYSPTGAWGNPTLATAQKGATLAEAFVGVMLSDLEALRQEALPARPEAR